MSLNFAGKTRAVYAGLICALVILAILLAGCAAAPIEPFKPTKVNPEPYTPEPSWNQDADLFLLRIDSLKKTREAASSVQPGSSVTGTALARGSELPATGYDVPPKKSAPPWSPHVMVQLAFGLALASTGLFLVARKKPGHR